MSDVLIGAAEALQKILDQMGGALDGFVLVTFSQGQAKVTPHMVSPGDIALAAFLVNEDLGRRISPNPAHTRIQPARVMPRLS